jgi:hypothetical protein
MLNESLHGLVELPKRVSERRTLLRSEARNTGNQNEHDRNTRVPKEIVMKSAV